MSTTSDGLSQRSQEDEAADDMSHCHVDPPICRLDEQLARQRTICLGLLGASIASEFNTPLTHAMAHLQTLAAELCHNAGRSTPPRRPPGNEVLAEQAILALANTQRMRDVVTQIRAFSSIDNAVQVTAVDMTTVLDMAIEMGRNSASLQLRPLMPQNEVLKVEANSDQLARALSNLLSAAAHACQEGETGAKELTIVLRKDERDVVLEIGDGRYGGHVPRGEDVLKPFWGVPSGEKGPPLGFLLCATLIASFGGQLLVGRGHYAVRLPAATGTVKRPRTTLLAAVPSSPEVRQARILLVDDEPQVRQMVGRMLRPREVTLVGSAIEAQARIDRGDRFEAILSDVNMPHMTGMDLHAWLVTHHPGQARCMAFMTGSMSPKLQAFLERIRAHCLLKPFGKQEIHQIVDDLIASHQLPCTAPWER